MCSSEISMGSCPSVCTNACLRWAAGGAGATIVVCAVAFAILGVMQPDWFVRAVGTIGSPHSWPLWTISGIGCFAGGGLMTYAILSTNKTIIQNQKRSIEAEEEKPVILEGEVSPTTQESSSNVIEPAKVLSLEEVIQQATHVTIDPSPLESILPTEANPFVSKKFRFLFKVDQKEYQFVLPVICFYEENGQIYAQSVDKDQQLSIKVDRSLGRLSHDLLAQNRHIWNAMTDTVVDIGLNHLIDIEGYLSWSKIQCLHQDFFSNGKCRSATYFITSWSFSGKTIFKIPGLTDARIEGTILIIERDTSQPLINREQLDLLKRSEEDCVREIAEQLDNPVWRYDVNEEILSMTKDGNVVTLREEPTRTLTRAQAQKKLKEKHNKTSV